MHYYYLVFFVSVSVCVCVRLYVCAYVFLFVYELAFILQVHNFEDIFNTGKKEWELVFRGTAGNEQNVLDAYRSGSSEVAEGCKQVIFYTIYVYILGN